MPSPYAKPAQQKSTPAATPQPASATSDLPHAAPAQAPIEPGTRKRLFQLLRKWGAALQRWVWGPPVVDVYLPLGDEPARLLCALRCAKRLQAKGYSVRLMARLPVNSDEPAHCPCSLAPDQTIPAGSAPRSPRAEDCDETHGASRRAVSPAQAAPAFDPEGLSWAQPAVSADPLQPSAGGAR